MASLSSDSDARLSEAVVVWTGWGRTSWPARDERLVIERFGSNVAQELIPLIRELEDAFYASDAHARVADLNDMGALAAAEFKSHHPNISDEAVDALLWCYTYDYK